MVWLRRRRVDVSKLVDVLVATGLFVGCCVIVASRQSPETLFLLFRANLLFVLIAITAGAFQGVIKSQKVPCQSMLIFLLWLVVWLNAGLCFLSIFIRLNIDEKWFVGVIRSLSLVVETVAGSVGARQQLEC